MSTEYKTGFQPSTPDTADDATPIAFEAVFNAHVIHVLGAEHRNARLNGTFEVVDGQPEFEPDTQGFYACCYWFECKPKNTWMWVKLEKSHWIEEKGFNGFVVRNLGKIEQSD